jgi:Cu/Ag efflux pump CusA
MNTIVYVPSGKTYEGVFLEDTAIVQWQGRSWVYLRTGPDTLLASVAVALTVTPALSMFLLTGRAARSEEREPPLVCWSRRHYEVLLRRIGRYPRSVIAAALLLTVAGAAMLPFFGGTFLPDLKEGHLILHVSAIPGTSLDESLRIGRLITDELRTVPGVRSVAQHTGRAEAGPDTVGPHSSEFEVDLQQGLSGEEQELAEERMRAALSKFPGVTFSTRTYVAFVGLADNVTLADRLVPILMTSLVTGLGLLPLALGVGEPGREIEGPMAVVILGGLATSMALSLLILPTLALRYARFKIDQPDAKRESALVS